MIPHEKAMVERLKDKPFALIGINSDGDRDVSEKLDEKEQQVLKGLGRTADEGLDKIRAGDAAALAKANADAPALVKKVRDADRENLVKILDKNGISWRQAVEGSTGGPWASQWNVQGWPTIYVLDAQGVIRFRDLRGEELENAVVKLLDEAAASDKSSGKPSSGHR